MGRTSRLKLTWQDSESVCASLDDSNLIVKSFNETERTFVLGFAVGSNPIPMYNGSAGFLVDSNIWIDCIDAASPWHDWAVDQVQACGERAPLHINLIVYTELLVPEPDIAALDAMLDVCETQRSSLPWTCTALAAKAFGLYRKRGGLRHAPLPDVYIGAHAAVANPTVLTRDETSYRSYFPRLKRVCPV